MVRGLHFIFSAYGFWLPNDPRGSWSDVIREYELAVFGPPVKCSPDRSHAHDPHDHARRRAAKAALRHPPVRFTGTQARALASGIAEASREAQYVVLALAVLPDHVHLVMQAHARGIAAIAAHVKARATMRLTKEGLHPLAGHAHNGRTPSPWARNHWCPFLWTDDAVARAVRYVELNPVRAGLPAQRWRLVRA